jgi:hypothetical protein
LGETGRTTGNVERFSDAASASIGWRAGILTGDVTLHTLRHTVLSRMIAHFRAFLQADAPAVHPSDDGDAEDWRTERAANDHNTVTTA